MLKNILTIVFIFTSAISFAQDDVMKSSWVSSPVKIDGNGQEWPQPLRYYDPETRLFFAFANDDKNLYLCFQSNDDMNQMKIIRGGMEISLSTKNKHKATINFPLGEKDEPAQPADANDAQQKKDHLNMRNSFLVQNSIMEVNGFTTKNGMIAINDSSGINTAINWDATNKFTYEIAIPLSELFGRNYTTDDISKDISLKAKIKAVKKQHAANNGENSFSGRGGGGGGRMVGGGGMHHNRSENAEGGSSIPVSGSRADMSVSTDFKQKFTLAQKINQK